MSILNQSFQSVKCFCTPAFMRSVSGFSCENISSDCDTVVDDECISKIDMEINLRHLNACKMVDILDYVQEL